MISFRNCIDSIEQKIKEIDLPKVPEGLYDPIEYILQIGGKRIRPCLTLMTHNLFSDDVSEAVFPALGIEVFHNFTLLHDDIMDQADVRRGKQTVHIKWDENTAILSGDAMMILAYDLISKSPKDKFAEVFRVFNKTALEVCEGQQYDMNFETRWNVRTEEYLEMIRLKTSVLLAAALKIGGITGGASLKDQEELYQFGLKTGLAFQLQDDYLDVFADPEKFGKATGGDIVQNKKTYLMISALNHENKAIVDKLKKWIQAEAFDRDEKVQAVTQIYQELEVDKISRNLAKSYHDQAIQHLDKVDIVSERKSEIRNLVDQLLVRES